MARESHYFWYCNVCHAQNSREDGECQFCECLGPDCGRDSCSAPQHFHRDHVADGEPVDGCPFCRGTLEEFERRLGLEPEAERLLEKEG
jgi:hypothetical protein